MVLEQCFQENCTINSLQTSFEAIFPVNSITNSQSKVIHISPGRNINAGSNLQSSHEEQVISRLKKYSKYFSWDYTYIHGIHPKTCIHHIYTNENIKPVRQPQRRLNPVMKEIVK